jgi:phosphatidylserine/phosphatidylglycerophosphate/cardiolipin synthase-like enzyme
VLPVKPPGIVARVDAALGDALESTVQAHHRRRLRKLGHSESLDPPGDGLWARDAGSPPRSGNALDVLIDGAEALAAVEEAIRSARSHVHLAGWHVAPWFALDRDGTAAELLPLLERIADDVAVRVLVWAGSPLPLFHPDRKDVGGVRHAFEVGSSIRFATDAKERPLHCHHEKLVIVDDRVAFVGGIDLTDYAGDRWDTSAHAARGSLGWHDAAVLLRGPVVRDVSEHFRLRWHETTGELPAEPASPARAGPVDVQFVRTVPERIYGAIPRGDFRILEAYTRALRSARKLVYLENQFYWSSEIAAILEDKLASPPSDDFRVVFVLPIDPNNGGDDSRGQLADLLECDAKRGHLLACTLTALGEQGPCPVYVHAKIGIVDDHWLTIGSANLNEHSLFNDTEANVVICDPELVRGTRLRLWCEHLECEEHEIDGDPTRVIDTRWRPIAVEQRRLRQEGRPQTHRLSELPGLSRRTRRLLGPMQGLLVDG